MKKLKKVQLVLFFLCVAFGTSAQLKVFNSKIRPMFGAHTPFDIDELKKATTYFVLSDQIDNNEMAFLKKELTPIWKIGKLKFMRESLIKKKSFIQGKVAFITIQGSLFKDQIGRTVDYNANLEYSFKQNGNKMETTLGQIRLYPSSVELIKEAKRYSSIRVKHLEAVCGKSERVHNWSVGHFKNCLVLMQEKLLQNEMFTHMKFVTKDKTEIKKLKKAGFSIPDFVFINNSGLKKGERFKEDELFEDFSMPYTIKSMNDIDKDILAATDDYYYLSVVCSRINTNYTIWNAKTNQIVLDLSRPGKSVRNGHLKKIQKLLK